MSLDFESRQWQYEKSSQELQRDRQAEVLSMKKLADEELAKTQVDIYVDVLAHENLKLG